MILSILSLELLLPIGLLVIQALIVLFICVGVLKRMRILRTPYAGMEYSQLIIATVFLFSVFLIAIADTTALFQAFKTFQNNKQDVLSNTISKFSQFFLVVLFFELLFGLISFLVIKLLLGFKNSFQEINEGNVPAAVIMSIVLLGFSITLNTCAKEILEYMTPQYLNFR